MATYTEYGTHETGDGGIYQVLAECSRDDGLGSAEYMALLQGPGESEALWILDYAGFVVGLSLQHPGDAAPWQIFNAEVMDIIDEYVHDNCGRVAPVMVAAEAWTWGYDTLEPVEDDYTGEFVLVNTARRTLEEEYCTHDDMATYDEDDRESWVSRRLVPMKPKA